MKKIYIAVAILICFAITESCRKQQVETKSIEQGYLLE